MQHEKVTVSTSRCHSDDYAVLQPCIPSLEPDCHISTTKSLPQLAPPLLGAKSQVDSGGVCSKQLDAVPRLVQHTLPVHSETSISPYACYYGGPKQFIKMGWLDKLSPQG